MIDDLRKDHDPRATAEERQWMAADFYGLLSRFILVAGIAIMLGVSAAVLVDRDATPLVASTAPPH
jgi:hypothetical protein